MTCAVGLVCCLGSGTATSCLSACPDGGFVTIQCDGPEDCMSNPCCGPITSGRVVSANCTSAPTACPPTFDFASSSGQTRLCHVDADCTSGAPGTTLPNCCTIPQSGYDYHVCYAQAFISLVPGGHCP